MMKDKNLRELSILINLCSRNLSSARELFKDIKKIADNLIATAEEEQNNTK